jgi:hypothetical protein
MVLEVSIHHSGEGVAEQSWQTGRGDRERERGRDTERDCHFFPFYSTLTPFSGMVPLTLRMGLPPWLILTGNTHAEVCFTNFLDISKFNQVDNQD